MEKGAALQLNDLLADGATIAERRLAAGPSYATDGGDIGRSPPELKKSEAVPGGVPLKNPRLVGGQNEALFHEVTAALQAGGDGPAPFVLCLGGDHSIGLGSTLAALEKGRAAGGPKVGVLWVDAHADTNTPITTPSGNIHGQPLSWLSNLEKLTTGSCMSEYPGFGWLRGRIPQSKEATNELLESVVYVGLRDVDAAEQSVIDGEYAPLPIDKMLQFTSRDVTTLGVEEVMRRTLAHFDSLEVEQIWVSYDIDAVNPAWVPCTGTDVDGGLSLYDSLYIPLALAADGRMLGMDNVELNVDIGPKAHGAALSQATSHAR